MAKCCVLSDSKRVFIALSEWGSFSYVYMYCRHCVYDRQKIFPCTKGQCGLYILAVAIFYEK